MSFLLDSSAWLAHMGNESGAIEVSDIFSSRELVNLSALSIFEMAMHVKRLGLLMTWDGLLQQYSPLINEILPIDQATSKIAIKVREVAGARLAAIDAMIAATAIQHDLTLVHRDPHFDEIPETLLKVHRLPPK